MPLSQTGGGAAVPVSAVPNTNTTSSNYSSSGGSATGASTRPSGPRANTDGHRLSELSCSDLQLRLIPCTSSPCPPPTQSQHSCNPLSAGHSGPNSVDQQPGSVYGSDSVATPQGPSFGLMSPQQAYNPNTPVAAQMVSPVGGMSMACQSNPNPNPHPQPSVQYPPYQPQPQHPHLHHTQQTYANATGPPMSPSPAGQAPFRPPSNANSPSAQPQPIPGTGLPSPSNSSSTGRVRGRQYSPQVNPAGAISQSGNTIQPQQRHASPHPVLAVQHCAANQSLCLIRDNFVPHDRCLCKRERLHIDFWARSHYHITT
ncbi:unnamed protein product [Echinostoma caproni]|uniref:Uncharacterized protein n=1 Tax=Echinostoma caproni TaxID=27848 RepID=A0A3P8IIS4_9TREM|nr:unnamed protein product [Echinostoma caproni]